MMTEREPRSAAFAALVTWRKDNADIPAGVKPVEQWGWEKSDDNEENER